MLLANMSPIIFILFCTSAFSNQLSLKIEAINDRTIVGVPVVINLSLTATQKVILFGKFSVCDGHTEIRVKDSFGNNIDIFKTNPCPDVERGPLDSLGRTELIGVAKATRDIFLLPGKYEIYVNYKSIGTYLDRYSEGDQRPVPDIWVGELRSNSVTVEVKSLQGIEKEIITRLIPAGSESSLRSYEFFLTEHRREILKEYPDSVYAAWIIKDSLVNPEEADPAMIFEEMNRGLYPGWNGVPDGDSPDGWREIDEGRPMAEWQRDWARRILENHPEFPYARRLQLVIAVSSIALGDTVDGKHSLQVIAREKDEVGSWAAEFLSLVNSRQTFN